VGIMHTYICANIRAIRWSPTGALVPRCLHHHCFFSVVPMGHRVFTGTYHLHHRGPGHTTFEHLLIIISISLHCKAS
jgi:hypothetical protein